MSQINCICGRERDHRLIFVCICCVDTVMVSVGVHQYYVKTTTANIQPHMQEKRENKQENKKCVSVLSRVITSMIMQNFIQLQDYQLLLIIFQRTGCGYI